MPSGQTWVYFSLEDETGMAQVTVTPDVYERVGHHIFGEPALIVEGAAEPRGVVMTLRARKTECGEREGNGTKSTITVSRETITTVTTLAMSVDSARGLATRRRRVEATPTR